MFVNQINGTSVGFTIFNLFVIDKSALLTVRSCFLVRILNFKNVSHSCVCYNRLSLIVEIEYSHMTKSPKKFTRVIYAVWILWITYQWPLLLTWINFNPSMDK